MANPKRPQIVTPKGVAVYPHLNTPDTKFNPEGEYKVNLKVHASEAEGLISELTKMLDEYHAEEIKKNPKIAAFNKALPMDEEYDDNGQKTGFVIFKFKQKASIISTKGETINFKVALFDASRTPTTVNVGGGSVIKVAASVWPYAMPTSKTVGLSLRPSAVQIIELKEFGGGSSAASMFDKEDGFTANEAAEAFDEGDDEGDF